jgi:hypothetical protein
MRETPRSAACSSFCRRAEHTLFLWLEESASRWSSLEQLPNNSDRLGFFVATCGLGWGLCFYRALSGFGMRRGFAFASSVFRLGQSCLFSLLLSVAWEVVAPIALPQRAESISLASCSWILRTKLGLVFMPTVPGVDSEHGAAYPSQPRRVPDADCVAVRACSVHMAPWAVRHRWGKQSPISARQGFRGLS